ncbi:MAG: DUF805 domain-containing protein [Xanthobacteraceae bacterium]|jgi:uncharacterized membrane protein YhaH (DUF805 family)
MGFGQAISSGFSNYVNFSGRSSRSEYWFWVLFVLIADVVAIAIDAAIGMQIVSSLFGLAVLLPGLAVTVRRLHDLDRTGWWIFLGLIPLVGAIILIIWFCSKGTDGLNRFGADPLGGLAPQMRAA